MKGTDPATLWVATVGAEAPPLAIRRGVPKLIAVDVADSTNRPKMLPACS
jgi:hypothetical protein